MSGPKRIGSLLLIGALLTIAGCGGYSGSADPATGEPSPTGYQWRSLYRSNVQTVAIPIFSNKDYHRGVEFTLSKAVVQAMEAYSPYKVVAREKADTILEGEISQVREQNISNGLHNAIPQEQLYSVVVNFTWKDLRTGQILVQRKEFEQTATFYPTLGEDQFVGSQLNVERLARGIVEQLEADW